MAGYKVPILSMVSAPVAQQIIQFNGTNWLPTGALPSRVLVLESEMSAVEGAGGWTNGPSLASCHSATSGLLTAVDSQLLLIESEVASNDSEILLLESECADNSTRITAIDSQLLLIESEAASNDSEILLLESEISSNDVDIASLGSIHAATRSELQLVSAAGGGGNLAYDSTYSCLIGTV